MLKGYLYRPIKHLPPLDRKSHKLTSGNTNDDSLQSMRESVNFFHGRVIYK